MSALVEITGVTKSYGGVRPLRVKRLALRSRDRVALGGLDAAAAETLLHLVTGASVPDTGTVRVGERDTRDIATDTEWLASLDRFGIVTHRAVLIAAMPILANLALPLTLSIDPMSDVTRAAASALADQVGLPRERLGAPAATLSPGELVRVHLARALALKPAFLLLEHPTGAIDDAATRVALGETLRRAAETAGIGWLAMTEDHEFARASGATRLALKPATGEIRGEGLWKKILSSKK